MIFISVIPISRAGRIGMVVQPDGDGDRPWQRLVRAGCAISIVLSGTPRRADL